MFTSINYYGEMEIHMAVPFTGIDHSNLVRYSSIEDCVTQARNGSDLGNYTEMMDGSIMIEYHG